MIDSPWAIPVHEARFVAWLEDWLIGLTPEPLPKPRGRGWVGLSEHGWLLVRDRLVKTALRDLTRAGWPKRPAIEADRRVMRRLWERSGLPPLQFSRHAAGFLLWLARGARHGDFDPPRNELTAADDWIIAKAYLTLGIAEIRGLSAARSLPLLVVLAPLDFPTAEVDWLTTLAAPTAFWFEVAGPRIAARWLDALRGSSGERRAIQRLARLGHELLHAAEPLPRRDGVLFCLHVLREISFEIHSDDDAVPFAARAEDRAARLALMAMAGTFARWTATARATGYLDADYAQAQIWLKRWEYENGDAVVARCAAAEREWLSLPNISEHHEPEA